MCARARHVKTFVEFESADSSMSIGSPNIPSSLPWFLLYIFFLLFIICRYMWMSINDMSCIYLYVLVKP